ncbi:MAG: HIT family protein [Alphaproteobacteria bacterium]|nr:HIT family protein [Alphaproteobacteria bacterium]
MNATLRKFGHPDSMIRNYEHWCVLLRPAQATLGALILGARSEATAFSSLPAAAFAELHLVTGHIETALRAFRHYDRINYLMLMMVDPHVHFHVLPRYAAAPEHLGLAFADPGWPGPPDLKSTTALDQQQFSQLRGDLQALWPSRE